jgi:hypothetical protein
MVLAGSHTALIGLAARRNDFVAALADEVFIAHATVGENLEELIPRLQAWGIPQVSPQPQPAGIGEEE